ncbi:MAG: hypothetical protein ACFFD4_22720 [Candidatus Odinarchaeota archaeon]
MKTYPYPLGLPRGTIRATMTLLFCLTAFILIFLDKSVLHSLSTTIVITVSFYFGTRKGIPPKTETLKKMQTEKGETAFNLPANTVRSILFIGFVLVSLKILLSPSGTYTDFPAFVLEVLIMISGYVGGAFLSRFIKLFQDDQEAPGLVAKIIFHGKAIIVLFFTFVTCILYFIDGLNLMSTGLTSETVELIGWATNLLIGFYFGSRK